jgi:ribose 5-phosphate isomerase A
LADVEAMKRSAAEASLKFLKDGMVLGLGTGSTARLVLEGIARLVRDGMDLRGVPTSLATAEAAKILGIPLTSLEEHPKIDVALDGADEVAPNLDLIKGHGGALFREKIVAAASKKFVTVVDETKLVRRLGSKSPVPIEIHPFGWNATLTKIKALGSRAVLRLSDGSVYRTDNGNHIVDAAFGPIPSPKKLAAEIEHVPGVVAHGLFLGMADAIVVGTAKGVRTMRPTRRT